MRTGKEWIHVQVRRQEFKKATECITECIQPIDDSALT